MLKCSCCKQIKDINCFYHHPSIKPGGVRKKCNDCRNAYRKLAHKKNPAIKRNQANAWAKRNKPKLAAIARHNRKADPARFKGYSLKKDFGISIEDFNRMLVDQKGVCAICLRPERAMLSGKVKALAVDHVKETGKVRQLLCSACNQGIGKLEHSPEFLRRAADYVERHNQ